MTIDDLEMLVSYGEDSRVERKKELRLVTPWLKTEFIKDIMALANGHDQSPAYLLIGVDDAGKLHDIGEGIPDEASLQHLVSSHLAPPVLFSLGRYTVRGVKIAVLTIPPSMERFHVVSKNVFGPDGKPLLRQGEMWIRRGTAKMPPQALDFKMLKEAFAREHAPQPTLDVCFAGESREFHARRNWPLPAQVAIQILAHLIVPPPAGRLDWHYRFVPVRLFIHNRGRHRADSVVVDVVFSENCQVIASAPDERNPHAWQTSVSRRGNRVRIEGERLVHGDFRWSCIVYLRLLQHDLHYTLGWTARAGNVAEPTVGTLQVWEVPSPLGPQAPPPTRAQTGSLHQ